jgi:hypothetical protein
VENFVVLRAVMTAVPERVPAASFLARVFVRLDELMAGAASDFHNSLFTGWLLMSEAPRNVRVCVRANSLLKSCRSGVTGRDVLAWAQLEGEKLRSWLSYVRRLRRRSPAARHKQDTC